MKVLIDGKWQEFKVEFVRCGNDLILSNPPEELLASLCGISQLPVSGARLPRMNNCYDLLIAVASPIDVDDTYGENEYSTEVTYNAHELEQIKMLFYQSGGVWYNFPQ